jgi:DNA-binding GntR family transcriptional regulator
MGMAEPSAKSNYSSLKRTQYLSLVDIAYNALLEAIINQEFEPGAQISIDHLAKQLNMSNTPIREALMRAKGERLVMQKTNYGFVVSRILTQGELHDLFDVRHLLESHAAQNAVITATAVEALKGIVERMAGTPDGAVYVDFKDYMLLDHEFHRGLIALANNSILLKTWDDLHVHLHLSRLYTGVGLFDRDHSVNEHQRILEAIQRRDLHQFPVLLSEHIKRVEQSMEMFLEREK